MGAGGSPNSPSQGSSQVFSLVKKSFDLRQALRMPAKAMAVLAPADRVKLKPEACFPNDREEGLVSNFGGGDITVDRSCSHRGENSSAAIPAQKILEYFDGKGLSKEVQSALKKIKNREAKMVPKVRKLLGEKKYEEVVSCTSSMILARQHFGETHSRYLKHAIIKPMNIEILRIRAEAYLKLHQFQLCCDDANAGLQHIPTFFDLGTRNEMEMQAILTLKRFQCLLLALRANGTKGLGDKVGALVDMRTVVALVRDLGRYLTEQIQSDILTLMAEIKLGCPRPHYTDTEIRAWNKELQINEYALKNRICANCGIHHDPLVNAALKICGGCKMAWFCGSECSREYWPTHKVHCRSPVKRGATMLQMEEACKVKKVIAEVGYYLMVNDNGPALVMHDDQTGQYYESLSDQEVFFVDEPTTVQREVLHQNDQMSIWDKEQLMAKTGELNLSPTGTEAGNAAAPEVSSLST